MEYPKVVQENIDVLREYKIDDNLKVCNIVHLYPKDIAYPDGFHDARFFDLICFNTITMTRKEINNRDGLRFINRGTCIDIVRIYADGSTMIKFKELVEFNIFQEVIIGVL